MINGKVFDWEDIKLDAAALVDIEILAVSYTANRPANPQYGRGNTARGYGRGNLEQSGSIELDAQSWLKLNAYAATQGGILRLRIPAITVRFANTDQIPQVDVLTNVLIEEVSSDQSQGDEEIGKRTLSIKIMDPINYSGVNSM